MFSDAEREAVLQLLANYENMARAIETFLHRVRTDPNIDVQAPRYRALLADMEQLVPVWREYGATTRVKLTLERRSPSAPAAARPGHERRRSSTDYYSD
jgi:hypothetical protein